MFGGIVRYPQGHGNVVLVNLRFQEREAVTENATKKRVMLATILRNLGAGFSSSANEVVLGADMDVYRQEAPRDLPRARVAWTRPFAHSKESAAVFLMQWSNPKPELVIASIDLEHGADQRAIPALVTVTAAR